MKWSTISAALCALPVALGGLIDAELVQRTNHQNEGTTVQVAGHSATVIEIVVLWVNNGGGATTSSIASAVSVAAAAAAPAATHTVRISPYLWQ